MTRLRLVGWNVQPVVMADDGEHLTPVPVEARTVSAAAWPEFKAGGDELALEQLRAQFEASDDAP